MNGDIRAHLELLQSAVLESEDFPKEAAPAVQSAFVLLGLLLTDINRIADSLEALAISDASKNRTSSEMLRG